MRVQECFKKRQNLGWLITVPPSSIKVCSQHRSPRTLLLGSKEFCHSVEASGHAEELRSQAYDCPLNTGSLDQAPAECWSGEVVEKDSLLQGSQLGVRWLHLVICAEMKRTPQVSGCDRLIVRLHTGLPGP
ncbi:unnamed protein product [Eretmochelys imbricata]